MTSRIACFRGFRAFIGALLVSAVSISGAFADEYMDPTRRDQTIPAHCMSPQLRDFATVSRYFTYSVIGGRSAGFTYEYPITREDASLLWIAFKADQTKNPSVLKQIASSPALSRDFKILQTYGVKMGFDFEKEGDILEALALVDLQRLYPAQEYYFTGGVSYHSRKQKGSLGELDLLVARRSDCAIVAVGEAKLGVDQRAHANQQLQRFNAFAQKNICQGDIKKTAPLCQIGGTR